MVTGRYSRLLRSGTDEMTHFHTKRNRRSCYLPPQAPFCGVLADSHASFIYGNTLEYMTDALDSTPAGVYGGACSLDDFAY